MQALDTLNIESYISKPRLQTYSILTGTNHLEDLIGAYQWNKRVSSALYPILQCLEITLRNAVHSAASSHFATPDWYDPITKIAGDSKFRSFIKQNPGKDVVFYRKNVSTGPRQGRKKWDSNHENMLKQAKQKILKAGKTTNADAVVAELMLGFWVGLFESHYSDISSKTKLWPHLERVVFPNLKPSKRSHSKIRSKLDRIIMLRNRMSHHEPVWKQSSVTDRTSAIKYLNSVVTDAVEVINGISTDRRDLLIRSGKLSYFRGICSEESLSYYMAGSESRYVDKRKLKRYLARAVRECEATPIVVSDKGNPKFVVDLWLP